MKITFTLFCTVLCLSLFSQDASNPGEGANNAEKETRQPATIRTHCGRTPVGSSKPLFLVNRVPAKSSDVVKINLNDIESITILKSAEATAIYGPDGVNGAIMITLRSDLPRIITILDSNNRMPIPFATVTFFRGTDSLRFAANEIGRIDISNDIDLDGREMEITAVGYEVSKKSWDSTMGGIGTVVLLERKVMDCDEVVVVGPIYIRRERKLSYDCGKTRRQAEQDELVDSPIIRKEQPLANSIYPNPVRKGNMLHVRLSADNISGLTIRILTLHGQPVATVKSAVLKGNGVIEVPVPGNIATGTYLITAQYENGRVAASGRVLIQ